MKKTWRDTYPVHPAADVFPMMPEAELRDLGEDIKKNGLRNPVVFWADHSGNFPGANDPEKTRRYVLDGRNRLAAMELARVKFSQPSYGNPQTKIFSARIVSAPFGADGLGEFEERPGEVVDPVAYVISANIKRRHLTKAQQADLIVAAVKTGGGGFSANVARNPESQWPTQGPDQDQGGRGRSAERHQQEDG